MKNLSTQPSYMHTELIIQGIQKESKILIKQSLL